MIPRPSLSNGATAIDVPVATELFARAAIVRRLTPFRVTAIRLTVMYGGF
jgi:hypothetical protein